MSDDDGFFARWSRRKTQQRGDAVPEATPAVVRDPVREVARPSRPSHETPQEAPKGASPAAQPAVAPEPALPAPTLEDVARLTPQSDYSRFVGAGVDSGVQRAALRKLFSDPHFNVMDGLDIYIDDYNTPDPIPEAMLRRLRQSKALGLFDVPGAGAEAVSAETAAAATLECVSGNAAETSPDGAPAPTLSQSAAAETGDGPPEPRPDEDIALRLQPDDAADAAGAGPHRPGPRA